VIRIVLTTVAAALFAMSAQAQQPMQHPHAGAAMAQAPRAPLPGMPDGRQLAQMPPEAVLALREEMRGFTVILADVFGQIGEGKWDAAAETLEKGVGRGSMGRHAGGIMPGRYMPMEMHRIAMGMHFDASDAAQQIRTKDAAKAFAGLQKLAARCAACHDAYRVR
jgi:hypothetical protein